MKYVNVPLFDEVTPVQRELSELYAVPAYRASYTEHATYVPIKNKNSTDCDECFANQHETKGGSGPRAVARVRRHFKGGPRLDLCQGHADLWKSRDESDMGVTGTKGGGTGARGGR